MLTFWTIYFDSDDYPDQYVVRRFVDNVPDPKPSIVATTIDAARATLPPHLHCVGRHPHDDPVTLEIWL